MFSAIGEVRPHIRGLAIAGFTTILIINQLDPSIGMNLDYDALIECFRELERIINEVVEDMMEYTYDSDLDDSPFNDSEF